MSDPKFTDAEFQMMFASASAAAVASVTPAAAPSSPLKAAVPSSPAKPAAAVAAAPSSPAKPAAAAAAALSTPVKPATAAPSTPPPAPIKKTPVTPPNTARQASPKSLLFTPLPVATQHTPAASPPRAPSTSVTYTSVKDDFEVGMTVDVQLVGETEARRMTLSKMTAEQLVLKPFNGDAFLHKAYSEISSIKRTSDRFAVAQLAARPAPADNVGKYLSSDKAKDTVDSKTRAIELARAKRLAALSKPPPPPQEEKKVPKQEEKAPVPSSPPKAKVSVAAAIVKETKKKRARSKDAAKLFKNKPKTATATTTHKKAKTSASAASSSSSSSEESESEADADDLRAQLLALQTKTDARMKSMERNIALLSAALASKS